MTSNILLLAWAILAAFVGVLQMTLDNQTLAVDWLMVATVAYGFWTIRRG